jgi:hypothetical protein
VTEAGTIATYARNVITTDDPSERNLSTTRVLWMRRGNREFVLDQLMTISRRTFGAWDEYSLYPIVWPWVAARLQGSAVGSHILDIGAGVTPIPLFLAEKGALVDCVDRSPIQRVFPTQDEWNAWGFFDYGQLNSNISAHNCRIEDFQPLHRYEAIYSSLSLVHLGCTVRQETFRRCREWLAPEGIMLHALGLIPSTDFVWNRFEDREIEPPVQHGTFSDVTDELTTLGFSISQCEVFRQIPHANTDLVLIECSLP